MLNKCAFFTILLFFVFSGFSNEAMAAKNKKSTNGKNLIHHTKNKRKSSYKHSKNNKRRRHTASSVDLKALTTESPYTENSDNGVNTVETKAGIQ